MYIGVEPLKQTFNGEITGHKKFVQGNLSSVYFGLKQEIKDFADVDFT